MCSNLRRHIFVLTCGVYIDRMGNWPAPYCALDPWIEHRTSSASSSELLFFLSSVVSILKCSASKVDHSSPQFDTSSRRVDVVRWNWRNCAICNNNLNFRACFVFCSRLWKNYFLYFTQTSFMVSRCEWSAGCGLEAVVEEKRIPAL